MAAVKANTSRADVPRPCPDSGGTPQCPDSDSHPDRHHELVKAYGQLRGDGVDHWRAVEQLTLQDPVRHAKLFKENKFKLNIVLGVKLQLRNKNPNLWDSHRTTSDDNLHKNLRSEIV